MNPGDGENDRTLKRFDAYVQLLTRLYRSRGQYVEIDLSGVAQQTLFEAHKAMQKLLQMNEAEQAAWLHQVYDARLIDEVRKLNALKRRDGRKQQPLDEHFPADQSTPSQSAIRREQQLQLAEALGELPEDQRTAFEMKHLQGCTVEEIAQRMQRSKGAVAKLIERAIAKLHGLLGGSEGD
jgi:RNA polymerase sigma-70 factor (ECF subfamily)